MINSSHLGHVTADGNNAEKPHLRKGITINYFTERVTLKALDQSTLPLLNQDQFGCYY